MIKVADEATSDEAPAKVNAEYCRAKAAECREIAKQTEAFHKRKKLVRMAQYWERRATWYGKRG